MAVNGASAVLHFPSGLLSRGVFLAPAAIQARLPAVHVRTPHGVIRSRFELPGTSASVFWESFSLRIADARGHATAICKSFPRFATFPPRPTRHRGNFEGGVLRGAVWRLEPRVIRGFDAGPRVLVSDRFNTSLAGDKAAATEEINKWMPRVRVRRKRGWPSTR